MLPDAGPACAHVDTSRLDPARAEALLARLAVLARAMAEALAGDASGPARDLPLLDPAERRHLVEGLNATATDHDRSACVHDLIAAQAARTPQAPAIVFEGRTLSYAEMEARANRIAHVLRGMGVARDVPVGLCLGRSADLVVAALAIWKAGGAYVPLEPGLSRRPPGLVSGGQRRAGGGDHLGSGARSAAARGGGSDARHRRAACPSG